MHVRLPQSLISMSIQKLYTNLLRNRRGFRDRVLHFQLRGFFVFLEMGLYRSRIEFLVMFEAVQHCL
jgi:hypothetical protein